MRRLRYIHFSALFVWFVWYELQKDVEENKMKFNILDILERFTCCAAGREKSVSWRGVPVWQHPARSVVPWAWSPALKGLRVPIYLIRIQHFRLNTDPDSIRIQGCNDQKLEKNLQLKKNTIYLSLGLHKERLSYRRSIQLSKENIQHFKPWNFLIFFSFCGSFLPSWIRIRIRIHRPDWIRI